MPVDWPCRILRHPPSLTRPTYSPATTTVITAYRVEAHDGKRWSFGIRVNPNSRIPEFCDLCAAPEFDSRAEAMNLRDDAARLCGGTLRVARVPANA